ncbi:hypothetical protein FA13DRAFT_1713025 [Coprinellus micaceus]|uniref:Uncharacterized protein n=1 Tax=Coprinellus micaceus TaxID=71717 RepID=A0A4Y7T063_COPMI|nr:hypothetical protein FA13DRAFT_1713025 [Coprinellus micaceus]
MARGIPLAQMLTRELGMVLKIRSHSNQAATVRIWKQQGAEHSGARMTRGLAAEKRIKYTRRGLLGSGDVRGVAVGQRKGSGWFLALAGEVKRGGGSAAPDRNCRQLYGMPARASLEHCSGHGHSPLFTAVEP